MFLGALKESKAKVVIFDSREIERSNGKHAEILNIVIRHCIAQNIGIIMFVRSKNNYNNLLSPGCTVNIWKDPTCACAYLIETHGNDFFKRNIQPFRIIDNNNEYSSEDIDLDVLDSLSERKLYVNSTGIDGNFFNNLRNIPVEEL